MNKLKKFWHELGPGLITGAADDDPSGIATYSQAGARFGFGFLWLAAWTFPLMAVVQEMCARLGLVTGRGLAGSVRIHYPKWVLYIMAVLLFGANSFNIGADLGAMARATQLLQPAWNFSALLIGFAILSLLLEIAIPYKRYAYFLKWMVFILFAYIFSALAARPDWSEVLRRGIFPSFSFTREHILLLTAVLGTTISPYLFFWQTSQEVEEEIARGKTNLRLRQTAEPEEIRTMRVDVWWGMFISNLVMFFIITAAAVTLFPNGIMEIKTAAEAARALQPIAGSAAYLLFTIGIIGTGLLAVPILAGSAAYALSESFGWREGLWRKFKSAHAFYGVIILSMFLGLAANFLGLDPIRALIYSAVANGIIAPVILFLVVRMSSDKKIMREFVNGPATALVGWAVVVLLAAASMATLYLLFAVK